MPRATDLLILPPSVSRNREGGRKVLRCECCRGEFPLDKPEAFTNHVRKCSDRNADKIDEVIARSRATAFTKTMDEELFRHVRRGGN
jgi:hypothetical protein